MIFKNNWFLTIKIFIYIEKELPNSITYGQLLLENFRLTHIQPGLFESFTDLRNLRELNLSRNNISKIDPQAFGQLKNLKKLIISHNKKLKEINSDIYESFGYLNNLQELDLSHNSIEKIDSKAFENLTNLKSLKLDNNNLKEIERATFLPLASSIGLIDLRHNSFYSLTLSYFNEAILKNSSITHFKWNDSLISVNKYKQLVAAENPSGGYKTIFHEFLSQFCQISSFYFFIYISYLGL